jgi:hypothetical protein
MRPWDPTSPAGRSTGAERRSGCQVGRSEGAFGNGKPDVSGPNRGGGDEGGYGIGYEMRLVSVSPPVSFIQVDLAKSRRDRGDYCRCQNSDGRRTRRDRRQADEPLEPKKVAPKRLRLRSRRYRWPPCTPIRLATSTTFTAASIFSRASSIVLALFCVTPMARRLAT